MKHQRRTAMRLVRVTALTAAVFLSAACSTSLVAVGAGPLTPGPDGQCDPMRYTPADCAQIQIRKAASPTSLPAGGGFVTCQFTITNGGNVPLLDVLVTDDRCSPVRFVGGETNGDMALDLRETWTYTCSAIVRTTTTNMATAQGSSFSGLGVSATATATVTVAAGCPPGTAGPDCPTPTPCLNGGVAPDCRCPPPPAPAGSNPASACCIPDSSPMCIGPNTELGTYCFDAFTDLNGDGTQQWSNATQQWTDPRLAGVTFKVCVPALKRALNPAGVP